MVRIEILVSFLVFNCAFGQQENDDDDRPQLEIIGNNRTTTERRNPVIIFSTTLPTIVDENDNITESVNLTKPFPVRPCYSEVSEECITVPPVDESDIVYCPEESYDTTDLGLLEFPKTPATVDGNTISIDCPSGFRNDGTQPIFEALGEGKPSKAQQEALSGVYRICKLKVNGLLGEENEKIGQWEPAFFGTSTPPETVKYCRQKEAKVKADLFEMLTTDVNPYNYKAQLAGMTALIEHAKDDYVLATSYMESISNVFEREILPHYVLKDFTNLLEYYASKVILQPGYRIRLNTSTLLLETALFPENTMKTTSNPNSYYKPNFSNSLKVNLPLEMIQMVNDQNIPARLQITAYNSKVFAHWNGEDSPHLWNETDAIGFRMEKEFTGIYRIIEAKFLGATIENLTDPFIYYLPVNTSEENGNWNCVYWSETDKKWISDGMTTVVLENELQCESSHLTAFSAILDPIPFFPGGDLSPITEEHSRILGILSSLGSALSIAGLFMTALTYGLFRCLRKDRSNRVLFHLCLSLLLLHLMSVTSERYLWNSNCFLPSFLLHYLLLTSLCWMLIEAVHMFQLLISVFVKPEAYFMIKRAAFAWGCPLIVVSTCAAIHPEVYYEGRDNLCLIAADLNLPLYYTAYLGPAVFILAINCFIFCRIASVLYKQGVSSKKQKLMTSNLNQTGQMDWKQIKKTKTLLISPTQIKGALTVMILVGVGWVLALFAIGPFQLFFKYLFVICNVGQGVFIFIFRVLLHPLASRTWKKVLFGIPSDLDSSTSSSLRFNNKRQSMQSFSVSPTFISASSSAENTLTSSDPMAAKLASNLASILRESEQSISKSHI